MASPTYPDEPARQPQHAYSQICIAEGLMASQTGACFGIAFCYRGTGVMLPNAL